MVIAASHLQGPLTTALARLFSSLGSLTLYLIVVPFLYWCVDRRKAHQIGFLLLVSVWLNAFLKDMVAWPRPETQDGVKVLVQTTSNGHGAIESMTLAQVKQLDSRRRTIDETFDAHGHRRHHFGQPRLAPAGDSGRVGSAWAHFVMTLIDRCGPILEGLACTSRMEHEPSHVAHRLMCTFSNERVC